MLLVSCQSNCAACRATGGCMVASELEMDSFDTDRAYNYSIMGLLSHHFTIAYRTT